jgi:DNA invertase Pin-like site-specific DNA recombinase
VLLSFAQFEREVTGERRRRGHAANARGAAPSILTRFKAALKLVEAGLSPTKAASQLGLGRSTVYREVASASISRNA